MTVYIVLNICRALAAVPSSVCVFACMCELVYVSEWVMSVMEIMEIVGKKSQFIA